jgi:hypothetical protein
MGFFDDDGGMFDLDGDGKTSWDERLLSDILEYQIFEEIMGEDEADSDSDDYDTEAEEEEAEEDWREDCEDGSEYNLFPEYYDTAEEYEEALAEAKSEWRYDCEDGSEYDIDPEDYDSEEEYEEALEEARLGYYYDDESDDDAEISPEDFPNRRRYNAACILADDNYFYANDERGRRLKAAAKFVIENADRIFAANYLSHDYGFLYAQAIKDNFKLPCSLPDEDEKPEMELYEILIKIAKRNVDLAFEIWLWCLDRFLPYAEYYEFSATDLTMFVIGNIYSGFPDGFRIKLLNYLNDNKNFLQMIMSAYDETSTDIRRLIAQAIEEKLYNAAYGLFKAELKKAGNKWRDINDTTSAVISCCKNYYELESVEYFRDNLFPLVKAIPLGMVRDEIQEWEEEIADYITMVESQCEKYAYSRKNAWRNSVPDGKPYGLDPVSYDTEQEYLEAFNDEKYGWRKWQTGRENYGLDVNDFETLAEFIEAKNAKAKEVRQREQDEKIKKRQLDEESKVQERLDDKKVYTYCGVLLPFSSRPYSFRTEDRTIGIGDTVIVPTGENEKEVEGKVVSVGQYLRVSVPYPVEKTKLIIRKLENQPE